MVETPEYVIYYNMPPHTRAHWARSVDNISYKYSTLNEG